MDVPTLQHIHYPLNHCSITSQPSTASCIAANVVESNVLVYPLVQPGHTASAACYTLYLLQMSIARFLLVSPLDMNAKIPVVVALSRSPFSEICP